MGRIIVFASLGRCEGEVRPCAEAVNASRHTVDINTLANNQNCGQESKGRTVCFLISQKRKA